MGNILAVCCLNRENFLLMRLAMSEYIPFSEEKAAEIAAAYEISPKTVRVWRFRGRIPARYDAGFLPSRPAARKDTLRVIEICQ